MPYPHPACDEHERHRQNCSACLEAAVEADRRVYFPDEVVEPWKARVREALGDEWQARIQPLARSSEDEPIPDVIGYAVDRTGTADALYPEQQARFQITFSGTDAEHVITAADNFDRAYV